MSKISHSCKHPPSHTYREVKTEKLGFLLQWWVLGRGWVAWKFVFSPLGLAFPTCHGPWHFCVDWLVALCLSSSKCTVSSLFLKGKMEQVFESAWNYCLKGKTRKRVYNRDVEEGLTIDKGLKCPLCTGEAFQNACFYHAQQVSSPFSAPVSISLNSLDIRLVDSCEHWSCTWVFLGASFGWHLSISSLINNVGYFPVQHWVAYRKMPEPDNWVNLLWISSHDTVRCCC